MEKRIRRRAGGLASLAPAPDPVRARAVLPGRGGAKYQALGAIPQPSARAAGRHPRLIENPRNKLFLQARPQPLKSHSRLSLFQHPRLISTVRTFLPASLLQQHAPALTAIPPSPCTRAIWGCRIHEQDVLAPGQPKRPNKEVQRNPVEEMKDNRDQRKRKDQRQK
jgi:hypothetical protein